MDPDGGQKASKTVGFSSDQESLSEGVVRVKKKILSLLMSVMVVSSLTAFAAGEDDMASSDQCFCYRGECPYNNGGGYCDGTGRGDGYCGRRHHHGR